MFESPFVIETSIFSETNVTSYFGVACENEIIIENVLCFHLLDECCHGTLKSYIQSKTIGNRLNSCKIFQEKCFGTFGENCALLHETER